MKTPADYCGPLTLYECEMQEHLGHSDDPHIKMRTIRVMFAESKYNYHTQINGTRQEVAHYFRGNALNVENYPNETMRVPNRLEFLPDGEDDDEITVIVELVVEPIPKDFPVQPLLSNEHPKDETTCGHCHLRWDDGKSTSYTPTPAGRCPFEYFHV